MKIYKLNFLIIIAAFIFSAASVKGQNSNEINRAEFFAGFSHNRVDTGLTSEDLGNEFNDTFGKRVGANGVNFSITGNFTKYVGAKFDFATHSTSDDFTFDGDPVKTKYRITTYLGGIQVKNNKKDGPRVKPFFHALAGIARQSTELESPVLATVFDEPSLKLKENNFSFAVGGGLDVRVHKRVDIRVFQVDYNPTYVKGREFDEFDLDAKLQNNIRFSFGIVIH